MFCIPPLSKITCIEDLRVVHQARTPRMFYDYADSGSYTESTYRANSDDFKNMKFRQRVAIGAAGGLAAVLAVKLPVGT